MKVKIIGSFFILMILLAACDEKNKTHVAKFEGKSSAHAWAIIKSLLRQLKLHITGLRISI